jgi:kynureninase
MTMDIEQARQLDAADPLAFARERFTVPEALIYLDGNSLGALPVATPARVDELIRDQWGEDLISSWNTHGWIDAPVRVAAKLAPIVGAKPNELLIADSTSVCLFKALAAAVRARPGRCVILTQEGNFPTDAYVAEGLAEMLGMELRRAAPEQIIASIDDQTAVVTVTHVDYRSGARFDMSSVNDAARAAGALVVWDLSHSAGAIELDLNGTGCELAVGCGYKYLNGGPGAPAFVYVAEHAQQALRPPLQGWMGHAEPFAFDEHYAAGSGIMPFLTGTPSVIALAALDAGLDTFEGIAMADVEAKARALLKLFIGEVEARCGDEVQLFGPRQLSDRGSHVCFAHPQGYAVMQALIARGIVGDFRAPALMRFGFTPLYTRFEDAWRAADGLADILATREWDQPRFLERKKVT